MNTSAVFPEASMQSDDPTNSKSSASKAATALGAEGNCKKVIKTLLKLTHVILTNKNKPSVVNRQI